MISESGLKKIYWVSVLDESDDWQGLSQTNAVT